MPSTWRLTVLATVVLLPVPSRIEQALGWLPSLHARSGTSPADAQMPVAMEGARASMAASYTHFNVATHLGADSRVRFHLREGLRVASFVTPPFLGWMRPGMRRSFEDEHVAGQDSVYRGLMQDDAGLLRRGNALIAR